MATSARVVTAETPAILAQCPRACADRAIRSARSAGRRGGGATPADYGWFAMAKSNVAGFEYQYGGGTCRRKSSSAAFIAAMVCAA